MSLTATLSDSYYSESPNQVSINDWTLTLTDPCETSSIVDSLDIPQQSTSVLLGTPLQYSFTNLQDQFSADYGDGYDICGNRVYSTSGCDFVMVHVSGDTSDSVNADTISIQTDDHADVNSHNAHTCSITVALENYPDVKHTETFEVIIEPCVVVSYTADSGVSD
jgi:hypothetical protein